MAYTAYLDVDKTNSIKSCNTTIADAKKVFYCSTDNCQARMSLVKAGDPDHAFFRRYPSGPAHISPFCAADGNFDPTEYDERKFNMDDVFSKLMNFDSKTVKSLKRPEKITGGGGKKGISTVLQIYCMCRKYEIYNDYLSSDILADERNFEKYKNGISGNKIVQCTLYHKVKDELAYKMNYPSFPYQNGKHIKINFVTENLFWKYYNKFKPTNHKELIIVLGSWSVVNLDGEYISECTIKNGRQIHILK